MSIDSAKNLYRFERRIYKQYSFNLIFSKESKLLLKENQEYKNCHKGKRCFILGNELSLKQEDLKPLANEIVFTVNQASRHNDFSVHKNKLSFLGRSRFF